MITLFMILTRNEKILLAIGLLAILSAIALYLTGCDIP